jgi:hypothetical protein
LNFYDFVKSCIQMDGTFFTIHFSFILTFVLHLFPLTSSIHMDAFYFTLDFLFRGQMKTWYLGPTLQKKI